MAEAYSDEELELPSPFLQALEERLSPDNGMQLREHLARIAATIDRLRAERDEARTDRDDARRVARTLAVDADICERDGCGNCDGALKTAKHTALSYPKVPHG